MILMASGFAEQMFSINFGKENAKFCLSLHYNHDNIICVLMKKKIYKFKADKKNVNFPTQCCLGSLSNKSH